MLMLLLNEHEQIIYRPNASASQFPIKTMNSLNMSEEKAAGKKAPRGRFYVAHVYVKVIGHPMADRNPSTCMCVIIERQSQ